MENIFENKQTIKHTYEHIMVCLSSAPSNTGVIQAAATMHKAFGGDFTALFVQTPSFEKTGKENRQRLADNMNYAAQLGAQTVTLYEDDIPYRISEYCRLAGVTRVLAGEGVYSNGFFKAKPTISQKLAELLAPGQLYIIPRYNGLYQKRIKGKAEHKSSFPATKDIAKTAGIMGLATVLGLIFAYFNVSESAIMMLYILAVMLASLFTDGFICGAAASLISVPLFDFLFTQPRFTFHVVEDSYPVTFGIMLIVSLIISTLAARLKRNAKQAALSAYGTKLLFDTNKLLVNATDEQEILAIGAGKIMQLVAGDVAAYTEHNGSLGQLQTFKKTPGSKNMFMFIGEEQAAKWTFANRKSCGRGMDDFRDAKGLYIPVKTQRGVYGVIGIMAKETDYFADNIVMSIVRECALAVENARNAKAREIAAEKVKNEQLRSGLLRTVSHDLRTPLTAIYGNADNLLANSAKMDYADIQQAYKDIRRDSRWLTGVVENILSVTRMGEDKMQLNITDELVEDVVAEAADIMVRKKSGHNIITDFSDRVLVAPMDRRLVMQVIINLIENRIKYTPAGSDIVLGIRQKDNMAAISVSDSGPGVPQSDKEHIFEMFYTGRKTTADSRRSIGLGLWLCKAIAEAHGGTINIKDNIPKGSVFEFTLPIKEVNIYE